MTQHPASDWIIKGPFKYRERLGAKDGTWLEIGLNPDCKTWPRKGTFRVERDCDGLPVMYWREEDRHPHMGANAQINWAPRGCFIHRSRHAALPPLFVSVNYDRPALAGLMNFAALAAMACLFFYAFTGCSGWSYGQCMAEHDLAFCQAAAQRCRESSWSHAFGIVIPAAIILAFLRGVVSLRVLSGFNFLTARAIWSGLLRPNAVAVPWQSLDPAFTLVKKSAPHKELYIHDHKHIDRQEIHASFGHGHAPARIVNGTWSDDDVRELHRMLMLHFVIERRQRLEELAARQALPPQEGPPRF